MPKGNFRSLILGRNIDACDCFLTCDDQLARKARLVSGLLRVQNPTEYLKG